MNKGISYGKVEKYILDRLDQYGALMFSLIDPLDYPDIDHAVETAKQANEGGADIVLVGGSMGVQGDVLDDVTRRIKENVNVPVILFPGNIGTITRYADAIYFMSLMNSRNTYWITMAQTLAAPVILKSKIEPLPVGYIVVEPGGTVGWVGDVNLIPRNKPKVAAALAMSAQFTGSRFIITDTGSNPPQGHIPLDLISMVKHSITVPYIVAGGIKTSDAAVNIVKAGADIVQIGTMLEKSSNVKEKVNKIVKAIREEGKKKT
ncbi:geranylgeranylglyceryl/heptaprenylglyceryl phosphate synthase [Candidatus Micrarchaeota archaeon]|nr:geranylgeranylglyceryl/heptaprenylglyceryl phosphate synthase [Candidatus Micrarchaeota archaeon]